MAAVQHRPGDSHAHASGSGSRGGSSHQGASVTRKDTTSSSTRGGEKAKVGNWRIGRTIGKGSSGMSHSRRVKIAKHAITGKYAAIKIVPKQALMESRMSMSEAGARQDKVLLGIEREIVIMKLIDHPNVLNLYDVWETKSELYLIMEYVPGGELFDYLVKRGRLPVSEALHYFQQIIHAVDYCHRFNICHRDLKPENLLLDKDKNIKVADFGMAAWEAGERMLETSCGSPHYASPEIVAGKAYHGSSSDIWSCGIILFALLTGRLPFDDDNIRSLLQKVKIGVFEMPDEIKGPSRDLLTRMLEKDPERRITMPEILKHPFFVSRSPRPIPGRALVSPPSLDEVERPVNSPEEIDEDIMGNLKTLWSGASEDEIIAALMSREKTWEKAIYHLLIKYRNKHLENYNMDEEEDAAARARRQARKAAGAPSPAKRKGAPGPTVAKQPALAPLGENETIQHRATSPSPASRPQAPTPKKASGGQVEESPLPKSKQPPPKSPGGPRPPVSRGGSHASQPTQAEMPATPAPAIVLQEATPTKEMMPPPVVTARPRSALGSPVPSETPQLPLNVPQVQDEKLQHFFNEVANQLNTMNIRSSVVSNTSSNGSAILGSDYQAYLAYAAGMSSPPLGPMSPPLGGGGQGNGLEVEVDPNQFADADDDHSEVASIISSVHTGRHSPLVGLGLGGPPHGQRPGLHPAQNQNNNRWSYASSTGSSHRGSVYPVESPMQSPVTTFGGAQEFIGSTQPLHANRPAPVPPPRAASRLAPTRTPPSVPAPKRESTLPRDESFVVIDSDTPEDPSLNSWNSRSSKLGGQDAFGMLKKRKKNLNIEPVPFSPSLSGPSSAGSGISPKRSWFNNLFSFKAPSFTLVSSDNIGNTRERAKKLLGGINVRTETIEIDGLRALKCRYDEVKDPHSGVIITKGVRFRIEFSRSAPMSSGGYNTLVSLTQEKGAQSTFRSIFTQLKASFEGPPPEPVRPSILQQRSYDRKPAPSQTPQHLSAPPTRYTTSAPSSPVVPQLPRFDPPGSVQLPNSIRF